MPLARPLFPSLLLAPLADKRREGGERGWRLAPARVVQEGSRKRRAPILKHAHQRTRGDRIADIVPERQPEACAITSRAHGRSWMIHHELCGRRYFHGSSGLFEFPIQ